MSAEYPTLAEVLNWHQPVAFSSRPHSLWCQKCLRHWPTDEFFPHQADAWREACTIRTADQLESLPHKSLLQVAYTSAAGWNLTEVWVRRNEVWHCLAAPLIPPSGSDGTPKLPALLIWHPSWSRP